MSNQTVSRVGPIVSAILLVTGVLASQQANAALRTWNGSASNLWSNAANWNEAAVPATGDDVLFPPGAANLANTNDVGVIDLFTITFMGGGYTVNTGGAIGIRNSIANGVGVNTMTGGGIWQQVGPIGYPVSAGTTLNLNNTTLFLNTFAASFLVDGMLNVNAVISGSAGESVAKQNAGVLYLGSNNTFNGPVVLNAGYTSLGTVNALGTVAGGTTVNMNAQLDVSGLTIGNEPLALTGGAGISGNGMIALSGNASWAGPITLTTAGGATSRFNIISLSTLTLSGAISGAGGIEQINPGILLLSNTGNSYTGPTVINGAGGGGGSILRLGANGVIPDASDVTVNGTGAGGTLDLNSFIETVGSLSGGGSVTLGSGTLSVGANNNGTTFSGVIGGGGGLTKVGSGWFILTGANTFSGLTQVNSGQLIVNGATGGAVGNAGVFGGGTLCISSGGTVGNVNVASGGTIYPGLGGTGNANSGSLTMASGAVFKTIFLGPAPGNYSDLSVTGAVNLNGATLTVDPGFYTPIPGDIFTIISNDGTDAVAGTFAGLPLGASVNVNGTTMFINYYGGTGNDVVLTTTSVLAAGADIPTLTQWGMAVLAGLLGFAALLGLRRNV